MNKRPYVMSLAGFDPSGGAGLLSDIKTFENNCVYGFGVVTALTWQNDNTFERVEWTPVEKILSQIDILLQRFKVTHFKIGLIENFTVLKKIVSYLHTNIKNPIIVFDPILKASAGFEFHNFKMDNLIDDCLHGIYCITPNLSEAKQLFGADLLTEKLLLTSCRLNFYVKSSLIGNSTFSDVLYSFEKQYVFTNTYLPNGEKHGSGCVLSAALIAALAKGNELSVASQLANAYTFDFLASNNTLLGFHKRCNEGN